jgi:hypothetical protein
VIRIFIILLFILECTFLSCPSSSGAAGTFQLSGQFTLSGVLPPGHLVLFTGGTVGREKTKTGKPQKQGGIIASLYKVKSIKGDESLHGIQWHKGEPKPYVL